MDKCVNGHSLTFDNVLLSGDGKGYCKKCEENRASVSASVEKWLWRQEIVDKMKKKKGK